MWEVLFAMLAGGGAILWSGLQRRQRRRAWQDAAVSCGLQGVELFGRVWWGFEVRARQGPLAVSIEDAGRKTPRTIVVVGIPGPADFYEVKIRSELPIPVPWVREIEIGDEAFDGAFSIAGPMRILCVLLDAETRRLLLRLNTKCRLEISTGELWTEVPDLEFPHMLPLLLEIGQRFVQSINAPRRRLTENATRDPEARVRLQNLLLLIRELPRPPATVEALRTACSDSSPEIRLRAAEALGAEGRDVLLQLADSLEDDALSAQAISSLDQELPFERVTIILDRALRGRRMQTAQACLAALGHSGTAEAVETLTKVITREKSGLATTAAQALGATGSAAAEPPLILALQRDEINLRVAAANALGRVGSAAAVLPLKEAAERSWLDLGLVRATRQAIAEIQSRLQGASPGQLSLAGAEAGQLSLAQAEAGQLSLATEGAGQLSLAPAEPGRLSLADGEERLKP